MSRGDETAARSVDARSIPNAEPGKAAAFTVCREDDAMPARLAGAVAAIGNFDGVHRGHGALIAAVEQDARRLERPGVALTFEPHPRAFFAPEQPMFRLTDRAAKEIVLARLGLDGLVVRRFDRALADRTAQSFVADVLKAELGLSAVVIGHDFHFGRGREGNPARLAELCAQVGLDCRIVEAVSLPGAEPGAKPISSSSIRAALAEGDVATANALLGYRWFVLGTVQHGDKRGRDLGYPTANLRLDDCGLAHGIYAVRIRLAGGAMHDGVASYGRRPMFDDGAPLLEINLFDFAGDLYGQTLAVEFTGYLRGETRFDGVPALIAQMHRDAEAARTHLRQDRVPSMLG